MSQSPIPVPNSGVPAIEDAGSARDGILPATAWQHKLVEHRQVLEALERRAISRLAAGDVEQALRVASDAAGWAWWNHSGIYMSPALEQVVAESGRRVFLSGRPPRTAPRGGRDGGPERVLHVLSQAYGTGGHSRLAWRWMQRDRGRLHSVVLTLQGDLEVPAGLKAAATGGLRQLSDAPLVERCRELASLVVDHDLVVLHVHPHDTVATATCAGLRDRPPTIYVNHADHVFWVGVAAADAVVNLRPSGEDVSRRRRGVPQHLNLRLPLPLEPSVKGLGSALRQELAIAPSEVLLVTIAQSYKFAGGGTRSFTDLAADALRRVPTAHLVAVGPDRQLPAWSRLADQLPGRVHVQGTVQDVSAVLDAADVCLNSFPCTSITSVLEAAMYGVPTLSFEDAPGTPLDFDDFFVEPRAASSRDEWVDAVQHWCEDREQRRAAGALMRTQAEEGHAGWQWDARLDGVYRGARRGLAVVPGSAAGPVDESDIALVRLHVEGGMARDTQEFVDARDLEI